MKRLFFLTMICMAGNLSAQEKSQTETNRELSQSKINHELKNYLDKLQNFKHQTISQLDNYKSFEELQKDSAVHLEEIDILAAEGKRIFKKDSATEEATLHLALSNIASENSSYHLTQAMAAVNEPATKKGFKMFNQLFTVKDLFQRISKSQNEKRLAKLSQKLETEIKKL